MTCRHGGLLLYGMHETSGSGSSVPVVLVIIIRLRERKDAVGFDHVVLGMRLFVEMVG